MSRNNGRTFSRLDDTIDLASGFRIEGIAAIEQDSIVLRLLGRPANPSFVWMTGFGNLSDRPDIDGSKLVMEVNDEIYYSDNCGSDMNLVPRPPSRSRVRSLGFDDGVIIVALNDDAVYSSSNYGVSWVSRGDIDELDPGYQPLNSRPIRAYDNGVSYAVTGRALSDLDGHYEMEVFRTVRRNSAIEWEKVSEIVNPEIGLSHLVVRGDLILIHDGTPFNSGFQFSDDGGRTWTHTDLDSAVYD